MTARTMGTSRPRRLEECPSYVTQVQAAAALGISVRQLALLERTPGFPRRAAQAFSSRKTFHRDDLIAWDQANRQQRNQEAEAC